MAATSPQTVMLDHREHYVIDNKVVAAANTIRPGHLVDISSGEVILHATAADTALQIRFAIENDRIGRDLDTDYAATETAYFCYPHRGARIYAWLETGANVAEGAALEAASGGDLQAVTTGQVVAWADEAVNNSGGGSGPAGAARIRVRVA